MHILLHPFSLPKCLQLFSPASQLLGAFFQVGPEVLLLTDDRACKAKAVNDGLVALRAAVAWVVDSDKHLRSLGLLVLMTVAVVVFFWGCCSCFPSPVISFSSFGSGGLQVEDLQLHDFDTVHRRVKADIGRHLIPIHSIYYTCISRHTQKIPVVIFFCKQAKEPAGLSSAS